MGYSTSLPYANTHYTTKGTKMAKITLNDLIKDIDYTIKQCESAPTT
ncbi:hypothetical protein [Helicobacter trogontum]|nr:hypothetical protein [Helicobacter trogontum]MDY5186292.1 hypothetical protein [Helicobacter trogontum]